MIRRPTVAGLALLLFACRAEPARVVVREARRAPASAPSASVWDPTADGCHQIGGQRPDSTIGRGTPAAETWRRSVARGVEYRCAIDPALSFRITLLGDTVSPSLDTVVVRDASAGHVLQRLERDGEAEMPLPPFTDLLRAIDLDADGHRDLLVGKFWGATGNNGYDVWRYDPASRRFVADSALTHLWNPAPIRGRPCVSTWSNSSARDDEMAVVCLRAGRWTLDSIVTNRWQRATSTVEREIMVRRGDSVVLLKRETLPDSR